MRILKYIGLSSPDLKLSFRFDPDDIDYIKDILDKAGYSGTDLIGLCPCSASPDKDWNPAEAAKFINYINKNTALK